MNLALVGLGSWGSRLYAALADIRGVHVTAACRQSHTRPAWLPTSVPVYADPSVMMDEVPDLTAIVVASGPRAASLIATEAAHRGLAVLVDKPYATVGQPVPRDKHRPFLVGHQHLFAPEFLALQAALRGGIRSIHCSAQGPGPDRDFSSLFDYGPHVLAAVHGLVPANSTTHWHGMVRTRGSRDTYWGHCMLDGVPCSFVVGNDSPVKEMIVTVHDGNGTRHTYDGYKATQPLQSMLYDFVQVLRGKPSVVPHAYGSELQDNVTMSLQGFFGACTDWVRR